MSVNVKIDTSGNQALGKSGHGVFNPCNLIVNYLPQSVKEHDLSRIFSNIGPLKSCKLMFDRNTGYSFGYGFVEYVNEQDAKTAIETLNGFQIEHKRLKVAYARPNCDETKNTNLYIRNIPVNYEEKQLAELFGQCGQVVQVRILRDQNTSYSRRIGFVIMATKQMAQTAIQNLDNTVPPNGASEPIFVKYADEDGAKKRQVPAAHHFHNQRNPTNSANNLNYPNQFHGNFGMMQTQPAMSNAQLNLGKMKSNRNNGHQNRYNPLSGANPPLNNGLSNAVSSLINGNNGPSGNGFSPWNVGMNPMQQQGYSSFPNALLANSGFENILGGAGAPNTAFPAHNMHMHPSMAQHNSNFVNNAGHLLDSGMAIDNKLTPGYNAPTNTIYVYGIGPHATESDLFSLFSNCGRIQRVNVIKNPKTGQSKGFGFVVFETFDEANFAVHSMNGFSFNNRSLQVQLHSDS